jgi:hypothetical protein
VNKQIGSWLPNVAHESLPNRVESTAWVDVPPDKDTLQRLFLQLVEDVLPELMSDFDRAAVFDGNKKRSFDSHLPSDGSYEGAVVVMRVIHEGLAVIRGGAEGRRDCIG